MNKRWLKLAAVPVALSLVAAACGSDDDSSGSDTSDRRYRSHRRHRRRGRRTDGLRWRRGHSSPAPSVTTRRSPRINDTLNAWAETDQPEGHVRRRRRLGGEHQHPGRRRQPARHRHLPAARQARRVRARTVRSCRSTEKSTPRSTEYWAEDYPNYANVDGVQYGVPVKTDLKSLVWYQPAAFEAAGYEVPTTFEEFTALVDEMAAAGGPKPLCVGIESGHATGWTFTDWVEEMVLRLHGGDVYDQWVDPRDPVRRSADRRGDAGRARPVDRGERVRRRWQHRCHQFGATASRSSTASASCTVRRTSSPACSPRARRSPTRRTDSDRRLLLP